MHKLKEWVYMSNSQHEIQEVMQKVMDNLKDVDTTKLKRLLRNINNIFPLKIEDVDPVQIRIKLFSSIVEEKAQTLHKSATRQGEDSKPQNTQPLVVEEVKPPAQEVKVEQPVTPVVEEPKPQTPIEPVKDDKNKASAVKKDTKKSK